MTCILIMVTMTSEKKEWRKKIKHNGDIKTVNYRYFLYGRNYIIKSFVI